MECIIVSLREAAEILHRPYYSIRTWVGVWRRSGLITPVEIGNGVRGHRYFLDDVKRICGAPRNVRVNPATPESLARLDKALQSAMAGQVNGQMKRARRDVSERGDSW